MAKGKRKRRRRRLAVLTAVFAVLFAAVVAVFLLLISKALKSKNGSDGGIKKKGFSAVTELDSSRTDSAALSEIIMDPYTENYTTDSSQGENASSSEEDEVEEPVVTFTTLEDEIKSQLEYFQGKWSVYIKDLDDGRDIVINERKLYAADLAGLYCMGAAYQNINDGEMNEDGVYYMLEQMIEQNDREAFDTLMGMMPEDYINTWCIQNGYWDTSVTHEIGEGSKHKAVSYPDGDNYTTVKDTGRLLANIYSKECVSEYYSEQMLGLLGLHEDGDRIPAGLPKGVKYYNKTGATDNVIHDAAIVESEGAKYVLVIMIDSPDSSWGCESYMDDVSALVYKCFNPDEETGGETDDEGYVDSTEDGEYFQSEEQEKEMMQQHHDDDSKGEEQ